MVICCQRECLSLCFLCKETETAAPFLYYKSKIPGNRE